MAHLHASELARMKRSAIDSPRPGSVEEARALGRIDDARADEEEAFRADPNHSRRRLRKHWSERGAQLDGR